MCRLIIDKLNNGGDGAATGGSSVADPATPSDGTPPTKRGSFGTVTTLSSRSSSSSSITSSVSSSSSTATKRVSFNESINQIYPYARRPRQLLEEGEDEDDELSDDIFWYRPHDYRRFKSDICLEVLDRQQQENSLLGLALKYISSIKTRRSGGSNDHWMRSAYPYQHQHYGMVRKQQEADEPLPAKATPTRPQDTTRAKRIIEELAFLP